MDIHVNYVPTGDPAIDHPARHAPGQLWRQSARGTRPVPSARALRPQRHARGIETCNGAGDLRNFGNTSIGDQATFAGADDGLGHELALNVGIGRGYGSNRDHLILKAIVSVPFGRRSRPDSA